MKIYKAFNRLSSGARQAWRRADEAAGCVSIELPLGQTGVEGAVGTTGNTDCLAQQGMCGPAHSHIFSCSV